MHLRGVLLNGSRVHRSRVSTVAFLAAWLGVKLALTSPAAAASPPPQIAAESAIVVDARTGEVLYKKAADLPRPVASTQKLLTALLVIQRGGLDRKIKVTASDTRAEPTVIGIRAGQTYTRRQLLTALLVKSGNDVARCLARENAGSNAAFAQKMTQKARSLGMTRSRFLNANGLPAEGQFSTARDMARLAMIAYRNPVIRSIVRLRAYRFIFPNGKYRVLHNTNKVLNRFPLCNGMKTGYTRSSGYCLISSASNGQRDVICVLLGSPKPTWDETELMLRWALAQ